MELIEAIRETQNRFGIEMRLSASDITPCLLNGYCKNSELFMQKIMVNTQYFVVNERKYGILSSMDEDGLFVNI